MHQNLYFQSFQGAAGVGRTSLVTDEQEQRESSINYYDSQILPSKIVNDPTKVPTNLPLLLLMPLQLLHRRNSETLTKEEDKYLVNLWVEYYNRLESKDSRKYWDIITQELDQKFGNQSVEKDNNIPGGAI